MVKIMKKFIYRSDLAVEMKEQIQDQFKDSYEESQTKNITIEKIKLANDSLEFGKKKGFYLSLRFEDLELEAHRLDIIDVLTEELRIILKTYQLNKTSKILIVGLGNPLLSCDALGPLLQDGMIITSHLDDNLLMEEKLNKVALLIPRVKGQTGMETAEIIKGVSQSFKPDLIIVVDALATKNMKRIHRVIQISDTGIRPGSGVGSNTKEITTETLNIPVLAIGVPTVVDVASITFDVIEIMERYFADYLNNPANKLKFGKRYDYQGELNNLQKEQLFGELGKLTDEEKKQLLLEVVEPIGMNMIVSSKSVDEEVKHLANILAHSLNKALHY